MKTFEITYQFNESFRDWESGRETIKANNIVEAKKKAEEYATEMGWAVSHIDEVKGKVEEAHP